MDDGTRHTPVDRLTDALDDRERDRAIAALEAITADDDDRRKAALQRVRRLADDRPAAVTPIAPALEPFLTDEARPVRLACAKTFVGLAGADPDAVVPVVPALAARLGDEAEFYYVRARAAEALGYVALDHPGAVASPGVFADLRVGLSFDEPEVKEKLAKALEHLAMGDPRRLRHQVTNLASHLDDDNRLVRYHLSSALVVVGCACPERLVDAADALAARLDDDEPYVRGRAAEAIGLSARTDEDVPVSVDAVAALADDEEPFVVDRVRFALAGLDDADDVAEVPEGVGTVDSVRAETDEIVEAIVGPDADGECPHCGLSLPESGPPMCPRCGAPR